MSILGHEEKLSLDITSLGTYPIILGLPWLIKHNPVIDWTCQSIIFSSPHCLAQCIRYGKPEGRDSAHFISQRSGNLSSTRASDTPSSPVQSRHKFHFVTSPVNLPSKNASGTSRNPVNSTTPVISTNQVTQAPPKVSLVSAAAFRTLLKSAAAYGITTTSQVSGLIDPPPAEDNDENIPDINTLKSTIPQEFHDYLEVFNKSNSDKLPEHGPHDHAIPLEGDAQPKFGPIYSLSEVELKALD
ncbi:hypothetical protein M231_03360, partial [Tremella mesenterica]